MVEHMRLYILIVVIIVGDLISRFIAGYIGEVSPIATLAMTALHLYILGSIFRWVAGRLACECIDDLNTFRARHGRSAS